jgi:uncharacterized protein (TIGR02588 family)
MKGGTNWLEWTVLGVSGALVLACAGVLAWEAARAGDGPPAVRVAVGEPRPLGSGWGVPVIAVNEGDETAENVVVEVRLGEGGGAPSAEVEVPYLPKGSRRSGWAVFPAPPPPGARPRARVLGFGQP